MRPGLADEADDGRQRCVADAYSLSDPDLATTSGGLVFARRGESEPFTTSLVIAERTRVQHKNVLELIGRYLDDLNEMPSSGMVAFKIRPKPAGQIGGGAVRYAELSETQATLLIASMRNLTREVITFKKELVKQFFQMREALRSYLAPSPRVELTDDEIVHRALTITAAKVEALTAENKTLHAAIERDAPLVAKAEAHSGSSADIHRQEFAREVQAWGAKQGIVVLQYQVMAFLGHIGLFIRGTRSDTGQATAEAEKRGLARTHKDTAKNGHRFATGKLTPAGQDYAWRRIVKHVNGHGSLELPRELRPGDGS